MKSTILKSGFLLLFIMACAGISAQYAIRPYVGMNNSTLTKNLFTNENLKYTFGYQVGVDLQLGNKFYVQPGVQFEFLKNSNITGPVSSLQDFDLKRTYFRIPLMIGYNFSGMDSPLGLRVFTGPNAAFKLGGKVGDNGVVGEVDLVDNMRSMIWGWNVGVGIDVIRYVFVDAGYEFGLSEVFDDQPDLNSGIRNNLFYVNAGLRFVF
ncbi:MAG TPA: porin family protein [Bacteroidales bacterium]|nr:porin family protein [Bacteroidales bacterium]